MNRLADETSPYLLDHADNPVNWYPWGEQAFEKAREDDRPIFLSVGYSACHWCHVMKRESFEDPEIAEILNQHFVPIKVDREERPDVDEIYMQSVQAMTGRGGWPMSVFLTPELKPFYGGTYFPPEPRQGMPSFRTVLERVKETYQENRDDVENSASKLSSSLQRLAGSRSEGEVPGTGVFGTVYDSLSNQFNEKWGGFGDAPKFPRSMDLQLLCRLGKHEQYESAFPMVKKTLDCMMYGGIYDQIGGGFSRYSTDKQWLVPHFEKMLYDNAQLVDVFLTGIQVFEAPRYERIVRQTLEYIERAMTHPEGGFYSTQNAESEGEEGKYYVWEYEEFLEVVEDDPQGVADFFGVTEEGNFEGKNILHVETPMEPFCQNTNRDPAEFQPLLNSAITQLREHREQRIKPERDEKILTDWNGLMIASLARASFVLNESTYRERAEKALDFLLDHSVRDGLLYHVHKEGETHTPGFLDDYAFFVKALLEVFQRTGDPSRLKQAKEYFDRAVQRFWDDDNGGFTFTDERHADLLVRSKNPQDKAQPSGNSEMVLNALKLSALTTDSAYREYASESLSTFSSMITQHSSGLSRMICGLYDFHVGSIEVVGVGGEAEIDSLFDPFREHYVPACVRFPADEKTSHEISDHPLLTGRLNQPTPMVYLCEQGVCHQPVSEETEILEQIRQFQKQRDEVLGNAR